MNARSTLLELLQHGPVRRQDHRGLAGTIDRALREGRITSVLPGVYLPVDRATDRDHLIAAAMAWSPGSVITGRTAAVRQFWPELAQDRVELAIPERRSGDHRGFRISHRPIPPVLVGRQHGIRFTRPALTALDLCPELGSEVIDRVLRSRHTTPEQLEQALQLCPQRDGNNARRTEILNARGRPWSYAERVAHRGLWDAGISDWQGNPRMLIRGAVYYPDILFDRIKLVIEIDGLHHSRNDQTFQNDLWRMNAFLLDGYRMLRYTLADVERRRSMFVEEVAEMRGRMLRDARR